MTKRDIDPNEEVKKIAHAISELDRQTADDKNIDYKSLYYRLFNGISDTISGLSKLQSDAEEIIMGQEPVRDKDGG